MGRAPCCDKANVKKGPWSPEEDMKLKEYIDKHGTAGNWIALPHKAGLRRCGKSCRLRWLNYLRPNIKHGDFSDDEDRIICNLFASIGSRWSIIAAQLPGRTDNDIKNYWNTKLKKKLMGLQPPTQRSSRSSNHPQQQQQQQQREHHSKQQLLFHPPPPPPHAVSTLDHQAGSCLPMAIYVHPHQALLDQGSLPALSPYIVNPDGQAGSGSLLMSGRGSLISLCSSSPSSGINGNYFDLCNIFVNNGSENAYDFGLQSRLLCGGGGREDTGKRLLTSQQGVTTTSTLNDKYIAAAAAAAQYEEQEMKPFLVSAYNSFVQSEEPSSGGTSLRLLNADARQGRSPIN